MAVPIDSAKLRAWWAHRQGLDGSVGDAAAAQVLERTGWARSVGGVGPYLTLRARAGISREDADAAVANLKIHELPAARGCTYVVPESDFALALTLGRDPNVGGDLKLAQKLGAKAAEIDTLCGKILAILERGPLDPDGIKEAAGRAVRSFGEEGKKKGLSTSLPVALSILQSSGDIRRVPVNGRLDQQRYLYSLWRPNPCAKLELSLEECARELARKYWRWIGPATIAEFRWFSGLGLKAIKEAIEPMGLVPVGSGSERLMMPEDLEGLHAFRAGKEPSYALVSSIDGMTLLRRSVQDLLRDPTKPVALIRSVADLPDHAIFDRGTLIGLWEYDPDAEEIVWSTFEKATKALDAEVARVQAYVRASLGDARSFSLDSPKSRGPRIAALRQR